MLVWSCRPSVRGAVRVLATCCWFHVGQSFASSSLLINLVSGGSLFSDTSTQSCSSQCLEVNFFFCVCTCIPACVALNSVFEGGLVPASTGARVNPAQSQTQTCAAATLWGSKKISGWSKLRITEQSVCPHFPFLYLHLYTI